MGMTENNLSMIRALAENRYDDAKKYAIASCVEDTTKKNQWKTDRYKSMLETTNANFVDVPASLKGLLNVIDVSNFRKSRYYLGKTQSALYKEIATSNDVTNKLLEMGIPYLNSTLIYGEPGTGKTEFAKYVAYKLGVPFAYVNFSYLISSYMGSTSQNLRKVFDYCKSQKCVLLLDEIDCIGLARGGGKGADGELARTTISLMQCLDELTDGQIIIGATNREDRLDKALLRRFQRKYEFVRFNEADRLEMIKKFITDIDMDCTALSMVEYSKQDNTQAEINKHLIECIAKAITDNDMIRL